MAEQVIDQGRVWWPRGVAPQENVRVIFNLAQPELPRAIAVTDYETGESFAVDAEFERQGTGKWARYTACKVHLKEPGQRGRPFRWTLLA